MDFVIGVDDFDAFVERFSRLGSENIQIGFARACVQQDKDETAAAADVILRN